MTKFYTCTGDEGFTGLLGEERIPKYHPRTEAIGNLDEATASLGVARAFSKDKYTQEILLNIQRDLYHLLAEVSATKENAQIFRKIDETHVGWIEKEIDTLGLSVKLPNEFIVPGDTVAGAFISVARTIVRRSERSIAYLVHENELENSSILQYLNRLSSLLFVLELFENSASGHDIPTLAKDK